MFNSRYEEPCDMYENDRIARDHFRGGRYENFEIRYTREDMPRVSSINFILDF